MLSSGSRSTLCPRVTLRAGLVLLASLAAPRSFPPPDAASGHRGRAPAHDAAALCLVDRYAACYVAILLHVSIRLIILAAGARGRACPRPARMSVKHTTGGAASAPAKGMAWKQCHKGAMAYNLFQPPSNCCRRHTRVSALSSDSTHRVNSISVPAAWHCGDGRRKW